MNTSITINGVSKLILNLFRFTLPALIVPYIYRTLSPDNIGAVNYAESIYSYIHTIAVLGLSYYSIRELGKIRNNKEKSSELFSNLYLINIFTILFSVIIYLFIILFFITDQKAHIISIILIFKLLLLTLDIEWVNEAYEEYKFISLKTICCRTVSLVLMYLLVTTKDDYITYVWLNILFDATNGLISFLYIFFYKKNIFFSLKSIKIDLLKKHFIKILSTLFIIDIGFFFFSFDKIMLGSYSSAKEIAFYTLVEKIILIIVVFSSTLTQVTLPRLSILANSDKNKFVELVQHIFTALMMLIIPSLFGVFFLSKEILYIFGATEYTNANPVIKIFVFYILIFSLLKILGSQILFALNKERFFIKLLIFFSLINICIKLYMKEQLTAQNSILITMILLSILSLFLYIYTYYIAKIKFKIINRSITIYILASLPMVMIPFLHKYCDNIPTFVILSVIYSSVSYTLILLFTKEQISQKLIRKILKKIHN
ncbi:oligosaccharide flippase family protein [Xenorhabdus szentirmaii]|uniref:Polysaccharide biosynthesis protein n=1 Tax=Xenorhabdus szentirmaii DSM 16338 TaxID=1427518 RepID=W1J3S0_9GAMM|nr:oligosaccharide flippase family protein [Xenorhabdus szentirmaii]PHM34347.1 Polysaccharide Transporter, PST family [Xenorhabdus szentirmaii DSM 16338]CDL84095.1 Polysaccharide biosynthesis protein [Xenorhabdus szentirmaii DSM 16338]